MTQYHPITPPPELVAHMCNETLRETYSAAYAAGADMELEACIAWLDRNGPVFGGHHLRIDRRPKPPSLKAEALGALSRADKNALTNPLTGEVAALRTILNKEQSDTIRRALNELSDN